MAYFPATRFLFTILGFTLVYAFPECVWTSEMSICEYVQIKSAEKNTVECRIHSLWFCVCQSPNPLALSPCENEGQTRQMVTKVICGQNSQCCPNWSDWSRCDSFGFFEARRREMQRYRFRKCPCDTEVSSSSSFFLSLSQLHFVCYEIQSCVTALNIEQVIVTDLPQILERKPMNKSFYHKKIIKGEYFMSPVMEEVKENRSQSIEITSIILVMIVCCFALVMIVALLVIARIRRARHQRLVPPRTRRPQTQQQRPNSRVQVAPEDIASPSLAVHQWLGIALLPTAEGESVESAEEASTAPECFVTSDGAVHVRKPPDYGNLPADGRPPKYASVGSSSSQSQPICTPPSYGEGGGIESGTSTVSQPTTAGTPPVSPQNR